MTDNKYVQRADEELSEVEEPPKSLAEFVDLLSENPEIAAPAAQYVLNAIESCGKRTVMERGEEVERWRFFDDPYGDGEHAVLGNTEVLNEFVNELRSIASGEASEKILWFGGPTATGKSELKRCFINGLRGYSRTEEGRRYTVEWNTYTRDAAETGMTYGAAHATEEAGEWFRSPVNTNPLTIFPEETRNEITEGFDYDIEQSLDPFSEEAFQYLKRQYLEEGEDDVFSQVVDDSNLRIVRNHLDIGDGIGVLHSEDGGKPKERLVGSWMPNMYKEYSSRGRKNPQAFSFDGVVSQGNGSLSIIEDAGQNADLLAKLLNIPEENLVKLDKKLTMGIDTVLIVISNPDLDGQLNQHAESINDPHKAIRRRLDKYNFRYLTNFETETNLLRRELGTTNSVEDGEPIESPVELNGTELAPHAIEGAAFYNVITRLSRDGMSADLSLLDKAKAFKNGYILEERVEEPLDGYDLASPDDGRQGFPVTFTQDVIVDLTQSDEEVVMPRDVINEMQDKLHEEPTFNNSEKDYFANRAVEAKEYIGRQMEEDVLDALLADEGPTEAEVEEYVEGVFAWNEADTDSDEGEDFDAHRLKEFERENFNAHENGYTEGAIPKSDVKDFRVEKIINPINSHVWENVDEGEEVDPRASPVLQRLLEKKNWDMVADAFPDIAPAQWDSPPENTETFEVKEKTIERLKEMGYSEESAERASYRAVTGASDWLSTPTETPENEVKSDGN